MNPLWTTIEAALAQVLVGALWQVAALTAMAALVLAAMARSSAASRHAVGLLFMVAMVAWPGWHLVDALQAATPAAPAGPAAGAPGSAAPVAPWATALPTGWQAPPWLAWAWAAGVGVMLVRLGGGWWWLRALEQRPVTQPVPAAWQRRAERLRLALGITRPVRLRLLAGTASPFTARAWKPVIWLPLALLTKLAPEQVEALLAHELAHIRRLDWLWNGLQCMVEALLFFHPGVWWLGRRVRLAREQACDDLAASACGDALVVAEALAALEGLRAQAMPRLALAAGGGPLQRRVAHLLSARPPATPRRGLAALLATLLCAGGVWAAQAVSGAEAPMPGTRPVATAPAEDAWWSTFGASMHIRIEDRDGQVRDYHAWRGPNGERRESYRVDGRSAELTPAVRAWIEAHRQASTPPLPPSPPAPGTLPALPDLPDLPDLPSLPPEPPPLSESPAFQTVLAAVQQDAGAVAQLGSPIQLADDCGPCRIDERSASLMLSARGPKGQAQVHVRSLLVDGQWQVQTLDLRPGLATRLGLAP